MDSFFPACVSASLALPRVGRRFNRGHSRRHHRSPAESRGDAKNVRPMAGTALRRDVPLNKVPLQSAVLMKR